MHSVRVGVAVNGMGVMVLVAVGFVVGRIFGVATRVGDGISLIPFTKGVREACSAVGRGVTWFESRGSCPQACKKTTRMHTRVNLLRTLAVYHNKPIGSSKLSPW
jgi:hypothetical protein